MKTLSSAWRLVISVLLAVLTILLSAAVLLAGFAAVYLPMSETGALSTGTDEGDWAWLDGHAIYYRSCGDPQGPAVVLVHGDVVEGSLSWESTALLLGDAGYRVTAIDLPGYGRSDRIAEPVYTLRTQTRYLALFLNEMGYSDTTVVGHGTGAGVVLQLAVEQPQLLARAVLVSPDLDTRYGLLWRTVARMPMIGRAAAWAVLTGGPLWRHERGAMVVDAQDYGADYWTAAEEIYTIEGTADAAGMRILSSEDDNLPEAIPGITVPVGILVGEEDRTLSARQAEHLAAEFPSGSVATVPGAGHAAQIDQPAEVADRIGSFITSGALTLP